MNQNPPTRPSLLVRIRDFDDKQAWSEFVDVYAPLVHAYLRKRGVQDADAADLTQDVMQTVARQANAFSYDPKQGSFRGWLLTITLNRLRDFANRDARRAKATGKTTMRQVLHELPQREAEELWNEQHQMRLFQWAAEKAKVDFRETTWLAFWKNAVEHQPAKDVASELNISVGAVHIAKSRGLARIREILAGMEE